jgi:poly(A) polymerase
MLERIFAAHPEAETLWKLLPEARIAGGAVRDALAGLPIADVDFAAPLAPAQVIARLRGANIQSIPTGLAHGTVTAVMAGRNFEITSLRRDIETDGRHATVVFTDNWQADASRRDFTINAMSIDAAGTLFDYFDGQADLAAAQIRFVGDAAQRIREDYLRILRFFRFFARYGSAPDPDAVAAITALKQGISGLSAERIRTELLLLLRAENPGPAVRLMQTTGVLPIILPQANPTNFHALLARGAPADPLLRIAALSDEPISEFAARLKLSNAEETSLAAMRAANTLTPAATSADLRRALAVHDPATLISRTWLAQDSGKDWDDLRHRIAATPRPVFPLQGRDITALGIPPGPEIGRILAGVHAWWLDQGCTASAADCRAQVSAQASAQVSSRGG